MRVFHISAEQFVELDAMPAALPAKGFLWLGSGRREFEIGAADIQKHLQAWTGAQLVDLHVRDLISQQLPSHFDSTSWYDLLVFRRLAMGAIGQTDDQADTLAAARKMLASIDTSPVGFAVFDRVLLTVHPTDCAVREFFAQRLQQQASGGEARGQGRLPASPADLMLRMANHMVDGYLELRRQLTDTEAKRQKMAERLSRVEESAEHAHHRLDVMEQRQHEQDAARGPVGILGKGPG